MKIESYVWTTKSEPRSAPSSMKGLASGSVMRRKAWKGLAPSTRAASSTSGFCDCRPARMMSIMNGVQRDHRELVNPVDAAQAERGQQVREQPEQRVEQSVLPDQSSGRRHDEERRDHQRPHEPFAEDVRVEEHGDGQPKHDRDPDHAQGQENRVPDRDPDARVGDERRVVLEPRELEASRFEQVPLEEAVVDGEHEGDLCDQKDVDERGKQGQAPSPGFPAGDGGGGPAAASAPGRRTEQGGYVLYFLPTASARAWAFASAWSTVWPPAITLANSWETWSPSCWNSSMSTYWMPT